MKLKDTIHRFWSEEDGIETIEVVGLLAMAAVLIGIVFQSVRGSIENATGKSAELIDNMTDEIAPIGGGGGTGGGAGGAAGGSGDAVVV